MQAFWRTLTRFDASKIVTSIAVRNTLGFTAAFLLGDLFDSPSVGVVAGLGALNVAYSDSLDPYVTRARRMLVANILSGIAITLGAVSGQATIPAILAAAAWAFGSGMLVALGTTAGDLGVLTLVTLVVFAARPLPPAEAVGTGLVAMAGGLLQMLLAVALWPVQRHVPERRIIAGLYDSLAQMASKSASPSEAPPLSAQISEAHEKLAGLRHDHGLEAERTVFLLNQAERIRLSLLTLGRLSRRMLRDPAGRLASDSVYAVLALASEQLGAIGQCALGGRQLPAPEKLSIPAALEGTGQSAFFNALVLDARQQIDALGGQIRSAASATLPEGSVAHDGPTPLASRFEERLAKIRANLSFRSTVFRHAVRLAVCLAIGDTLGRSISLQRTYWIPMTIAIVLKPDFTGTLSRGVLRIAGTYAGLLIATALFHFVHTGVATDIALMAAFTFILRWVGPANYGIFVTALSAMVVLLIATTGVAPRDVIFQRAINTSFGGLLAMLAYLLWPTWEKTSVKATLADMLDAYREYFQLVLKAYEGGSTEAIDQFRLDGRRARSNAEASVDRFAAEPRVSPARLDRLNAILVNSHNFVHAVMAMESGLYTTAVQPPRDEALAFAGKVAETLEAFSATLRLGTKLPPDLPDLRESHNALTRSAKSPGARYTLVNTETDRMVTSLNTIAEQLRPKRQRE